MKNSVKLLSLIVLPWLFFAFDGIDKAPAIEYEESDDATYTVWFSEPFGVNYTATINGTPVTGGSGVSVSAGTTVNVVVDFNGAGCLEANVFCLVAADQDFNILECDEERDCEVFDIFSISFTMPSDDVDAFMVEELCSFFGA